MFPENEDMDAEFRPIQFKGRKTGLFIPYWMADHFSDGLKQGKQGKACF
jgi:hypothetical protein